jgi:hypothetical protein
VLKRMLNTPSKKVKDQASQKLDKKKTLSKAKP